MAKEIFDQTTLSKGKDMDLGQAQVENVVAEPNQGSLNSPSQDDTAASDDQVQTSTEATYSAAAPSEGNEATSTTTESANAVQGDENTAEQDSKAQAEKTDKLKLIEVEDQQVLNNLKAHLREKGVEAQEVLKYDLKKLLSAAIILLTYAGNRKVDEKHVNRLIQALKQEGKKRFSEPITVCSAKVALMLDTKLNDDDGNEITLDHPDIDRMFVVLDGQHRRAAVEGSGFEYEADVVIISTPDDINTYVRVINAYNSNWNLGDIREQNEVTSGVEDKLKAKEKEVEEILPKTSPKYRNYGLTEEKEVVKKKALLEGKVPVFDEEKANTGIEIFKTIRLGNPDCNKNGMLTMAMLEAIFTAKKDYNSKIGVDTDFVKHFKLFMNEERNKGLDPKKKDKVSAFIQDFTKNFKAFVKKNPLTPDADEQIKVIDEQIQSIIDAGISSTGKVYERGSVSDIVAKMKERKENQKKLDEEKKKMDQAIEAAKNAYKEFKKTL